MSYYTEISYKTRDPWFTGLYFNRWFKGMRGPVLDIACSVGHFIAIKPEIIEGIDRDENSLRVAREKGFMVRRIDVDAGEMSQLEADRYEGIHASNIIEHLLNPLQFMKEIHRLLKPGGLAVIITPNIPYMLPNFWDDYTHQRPFTRKSLKMIAYEVGFTDIKISEDFRTMPFLGRVMRIFNLSPRFVARIQQTLGIRGTSLILEVKK